MSRPSPFFNRLARGRPTLLIRGETSDLLSPEIAAKMKAAFAAWKARNLAPEVLVAEVLRFVQDDVRYFSMSLGESSHRPKPAARTLAERLFGEAPEIEVERGGALFERRGVTEILDSVFQKRLTLKSGGVANSTRKSQSLAGPACSRALDPKTHAWRTPCRRISSTTFPRPAIGWEESGSD